MKKLTIIIFLFTYLYSFSQSDTIKLSDQGDSVENLIPKNWKLLATTNGDLNKDGISDVAFVIENTAKKNIQLNEGGIGRDTINLNPRILGIYFREKSGILIKKLQSDSFIILQDSPTMDEPFDGIEILESGILKIDFKFWFSVGSWSMSNHTYNFRFQNDKFELIDYEASERHRGTGEETDYSINFLTCKMNITRMTIDDNHVETIIEEKIDFKIEKLKSIQSLKKPFEWEFNGIYL
jgi:hypothetical protein